jgi:hypothetical protein
MLGCIAISGEGMQQDQLRGSKGACKYAMRARLLHAALTVALVGGAASIDVSAARAQTYGSDSGTAFDAIMQRMGLTSSPDDSGINYTERSPLVVPPTRDLPPPGVEAAQPAPGWPQDPAKRGKNSKAKPAVVPNTAVQTPNPPVVKKPWYDPRGWFDREEYANFAGEPVRKNLTDPPAGYRIPSPDQPYGISPDKKPGKTQASASDFNMGSVTPPSGGQQ